MLSVLSIPYSNGLFLANQMDIREIRRKNLVALRHEKGTLRALADLIETDPNYLSQLLSNKRIQHVGHGLARRLEMAMHKPEGWMDQPHWDQGSVEHDAAEIALLIRGWTPEQRASLKEFIKSFNEGRTADRVHEEPPVYEAQSE